MVRCIAGSACSTPRCAPDTGLLAEALGGV
jgi:hypothetical protein